MMDVLIKIPFFLMLCQIDHATDLNPTISVQRNNATVYFDKLQTDGNTTLEINFSGYTSNLHFTNVMLYNPVNFNNISINRNYTGRIQGIVINNGTFSFLLLNVTFKDSGNYTVKENSVLKGSASVLVARRILMAHLQERITLSFIFNETTMSSIKVDNPISKLSHPVVIYNATNGDCIYTDVVSGERMKVQNCVLKNGEFSFDIPEIGWLHKGAYFAWDDICRHLDSIFVDIQENAITGYLTTSSSSDTGKEMEIWLIISALGITIFAACLIVIAMRKFQIRTVPKSTMHNLTYTNGNQAVASSSGNGWHENVLIPEETRIVSTRNNSKDLTEFMNNKVQAKVRLNDKSICARGLDCRKSSSRTTCKLQIHSTLSSPEAIKSETAHGYDYVHEHGALETDCLSKQPYFRSKLLTRNSTGSAEEPSFEYSYVVQRRFMTLRPPAPDPVVTKKKKKEDTIANSFYSYKKVNKKSSARVYPSVLDAKVNKTRNRESHLTESSAEQGSSDFINVFAPSNFLKLEEDFAKRAMDSPQKRVNVKCLNSTMFVYRPEPTGFRDYKTRCVSQCLSFDYPRDDFGHASAMERGHQRSRSHDAVYGDLMINTNVPRSRISSASTCMKEDYYDSI